MADLDEVCNVILLRYYQNITKDKASIDNLSVMWPSGDDVQFFINKSSICKLGLKFTIDFREGLLYIRGYSWELYLTF